MISILASACGCLTGCLELGVWAWEGRGSGGKGLGGNGCKTYSQLSLRLGMVKSGFT